MFNDADVKIEPFSIFQDADGNKLAEKEDGMYSSTERKKKVMKKILGMSLLDSNKNICLNNNKRTKLTLLKTSHQTTRSKMWNKTMMIKLSNKKSISMKCLSWNKKLISYLKPHENVQKALKRLKSVVSSESINKI